MPATGRMLQIVYAALTFLSSVWCVDVNGTKYSIEIPPIINYSPIDTTFVEDNSTELALPEPGIIKTDTRNIAMGSSIQVSNAINPITTFLNDTDNRKSEGKRSSIPVQELSIPITTTEVPVKNQTSKENKAAGTAEQFRPSPQLQDFFEKNSFKVTSFPPRSNGNIYTKAFTKSNFKAPFKYNFELPVLTNGKHESKYSEELTKLSEPHFYVDDFPKHERFRDNKSDYSVLPAGGLYQLPKYYDLPKDSTIKFSHYTKNKNGHTGDKNVKFGSLKPRPNPMVDLVGLLTAMLPVGLIISALNPKIINVDNARRMKRQSQGELLQPYNYRRIGLKL